MFYVAAGFLVYCLYSVVSYLPSLKGTSWVIPLGLLCAVVANALWLILARQTTDPSRLLTLALWWDLAVVVSSVAVPLLFFGATLSSRGWVGLGFIVAGAILLRPGG